VRKDRRQRRLDPLLVVSQAETQGYSRASFRRACCVEKCHLTGIALALRSRTLA
jgi:hypothetical protein